MRRSAGLTRLVRLALAAIASAASVVSASAQPAYRFVQISDFFSPAYDVNDRGEVVGYGGDAGAGGYRWTAADGQRSISPVVNGTTQGPCYSYFPPTLRINAGGTVTGVASQTLCGVAPFDAVTWQPDGQITFLNTEAGGNPRGINASGVVVGVFRGNDQIGFRWTPDDGIERLGPGEVSDINDNGIFVGSSALRSYIQSGTTSVPLPPISTLPETIVYQALAINNSAQVVGRYIGDVQGVFLWSIATGTVDLHAPPGFPEFVNVNDRGTIVATIGVPGVGRIPYLFKNGGWTDLNTLLPEGADFMLQTATAINNHGWIVGSGSTVPPFELQQGYVLIPPSVDMTANGVDDVLALHTGEPLAIRLAFDAAIGPTLDPTELYLGVATAGSAFWLGPGGFRTTPTRLYVGPLPSFPPAPLFSFPSGLPPGTYLWFVVLDRDSNGIINGDFFDYVVTTITP